MSKVKVSLTASYSLTGKVKEEYLEWLGDYKDTKKMRKAFFTDRFLNPIFWELMEQNPTLLDYKNIKINYEEE